MGLEPRGLLRDLYEEQLDCSLTVPHPTRQATSCPPPRPLLELLADTESERPWWTLVYEAQLRAEMKDLH